MCLRDGKVCNERAKSKWGESERLAKRKQWILFNLIQLIYYGKRDITKRLPLCFPFISSLQTDDTCPVRDIKLTQMFIVLYLYRRLHLLVWFMWTTFAICHRIFISIANANGNHFWQRKKEVIYVRTKEGKLKSAFYGDLKIKALKKILNVCLLKQKLKSTMNYSFLLIEIKTKKLLTW